jgi:hypothetical protein
VVLVHVEVAFGLQGEIEGSVFREELQHVIEEADAGGDFVAAFAFYAERARDLGFFCVALNFSCSGQ